MFKKWIVPKVDKQRASFLAEECFIDPFLSLIALSRGYDDPYLLEEFLSEECFVNDPYDLEEMGEAVSRIESAIGSNEKIAIFGDYDCDGITSVVLLYEYLLSRKADVVYKIPNREEDGYGMNNRQIDELQELGVSLIITVDNGINSIDEIDYALSLGIDTVVTDHHLLKGERPNAVAIIDPHKDSSDSFKELAGVGVAFKLVCALENKTAEEMLPYFGDLVTIGTIADVMPLVNENRSIVRIGLDILNRRRRVGISALMRVAAVGGKEINPGSVSFMIAPRLNSAGRMADASLAVKLLLEKDYSRAIEMAQIINSYNNERQETESKIFAEACDIIEQNGMKNDRIIVVAGYGWHRGVLGIVASKLVEKYTKPTIVLGIDGTEASGSGRSFGGFSLFSAIEAAAEFTTRFGGHELAAGVGLDQDQIDNFREKINQYASSLELPFAQVKLDCKLNPKALSLDIVRALEPLKPYGVGNPSPLFGIFDVKIERISSIGQGKHLRLSFSRDGSSFTALLFGVTAEELPYSVNQTVDLAVSLDENEFKGSISLSVLIKDIRLAGLDEEKMIEQLCLFDAFLRNENRDFSPIAPSREEVGMVYKYLKTVKGDILKQKVFNALVRKVPIGKLINSVKVLEELDLIYTFSQNGNETVRVNLAVPKTDLNNSNTFRILNESEAKIC